jgi:hypothetical protein
MVITSNEIDANFLGEIKALGGASVTKCYQCASCTAVCPLTSEFKAFPRRTLRFVQLGLRERAIHSPDIWLCSACNTCKASCPRQADPGEIMAALRRCAYYRYSWLQAFTKRLTASPEIAVSIMGIIAVVLFGMIYADSRSPTASSVNFSSFLPLSLVDAAGIVLGLFVALGIGLNSLTLWKAIAKGSMDPPTWGLRVKSLLSVITGEVVFQKSLRKCNTGRLQWVAHFSLIVGFALAAITTTLVFILNAGGTPFPLYNPVKILGNMGAVLLLLGGSILIARRIFQRDVIGPTHFQDGLFLSLLFLVALTGTLSELTRLLNTGLVAYAVYSTHLVSTALLLGLAPYTKFAHVIYRPLAMYLAKVRGWPD